MAHRHDVYRYGPGKKYIEHEYKCKGRYGANGEKRAPKKKVTPEQIRKQNQWKKEKEVLRVMRENFGEGDLWATLKLPKGTRMGKEKILDIRDKFFRKLRDRYKSRKQALKYMYRIEIGERGGIHIHLLINRLDGKPWTAEVVSRIWEELAGGHVHYTPVYEQGGMKELADYLTKPVKEEITGQLTLFGTEEEQKIFSKYGCSRSLKRPEKETHEYKRRTIRRLVENGPEPTPGYYIDQDSVRYGTNPFTGMTYYYYTEIKLPENGTYRRSAGQQDGERWDDW